MNAPRISEDDLHFHLRARMHQRGITLTEIQRALDAGWKATDTRAGTFGKTIVLPYAQEWEGTFYPEKEISVYYKISADGIILLTVKARYGQGFPRGEENEN